MKLIALAFWCFLIPFFDTDCRHPAEPPLLKACGLYATSFEMDSDTSGWSGHGGYRFVNDAPPGGGSRSLEVSGGCIVPHAVRSLAVPRSGSTITLTVWGRSVAQGGMVSLGRADGTGTVLQVSVTDTVWTRYEASAAHLDRAGDTLRLEMMSGGIIFGTMRVDLLEVHVSD